MQQQLYLRPPQRTRRIKICLTLFFFRSTIRTMKFSRFFIFFCASLVFLLLVLLPFSFAQSQADKIGMSISPPTFELTLRKGETATNVIKFENINNFPLSIGVSVRNFTAQGEEGAVNLTTEENSFSLASWVSVSPKTVTIPANSRAVFSFIIKVPNNAEPGGHFGSIIFATAPPKDVQQTSAAVAQEIGALILLKIPGITKLSYDIASFSPEKTIFWSNPLSFIVRVRNNGSVHVKPSGRIILTNMFGQKKIQEVPAKNVLPDAVRRIEVSVSPQLLFGYYTATLILDASGIQKTAGISFWAFPGKEVLVIGGILLIVLVILIKGRRRFSKALRVLFGKAT